MNRRTLLKSLAATVAVAIVPFPKTRQADTVYLRTSANDGVFTYTARTPASVHAFEVWAPVGHHRFDFQPISLRNGDSIQFTYKLRIA